MEGGPPMFRQDFTCPALLEGVLYVVRFPYGAVTHSGRPFPDRSGKLHTGHWPGPRSLATTTESRLMSFPPGT